MLERILSGILSRTSFLEIEIKLFIFLLCWFLIMVKHLMIRLCLGLVRGFCQENARPCWENLAFNLVEPSWHLALNNNSSPFQNKPISKESISDQPVEPWSASYPRNTNSSQIIIMERFPM